MWRDCMREWVGGWEGACGGIKGVGGRVGGCMWRD